MKKAAFLLFLLLTMSFATLLLISRSAYALHEADIVISPQYFNGVYPEDKNFTLTNRNIAGSDPITMFIVVFPKVNDTDFKPTDYAKPDGWKATYEVGLRQVIFECFTSNPEDYISPGETFVFSIRFIDGPKKEGPYVWTLTTSDTAEYAKTQYQTQWIDKTDPTITIDYPIHNSHVNATYIDWPTDYYFWTNGTVTDSGSGVDYVEVRVYNNTLERDTDWQKATVVGSRWYYQWPDEMVIADHTKYIVEARAFDKAGNDASASISFTYHPIGPLIVPSPKEGTVGPTTTKKPDGTYQGSIYTYGSKTLGTNVTLQGSGFNENAMVSIYAGGLLVNRTRAKGTNGEFTVSFLFPTLPGGVYTINAEDDGEPSRYTNATFTVIPEIIYKPEIVIGPAVIEAIATGLPSFTDVSGFTINGLDALLSIDNHVLYYWHTDGNGVLVSDAAGDPGFVLPILETGAYEVALWRYIGEVGHEVMVSNTIYVANTFEDLSDAIKEIFKIEDKLDYLKPIIERIDGNVVTILTTVGRIETKLDNLKLVVDRIDDNVVTIKTIVGQINGTVTLIKGNTATIITNQGRIITKLDSIITALATKANQNTSNDIWSKVQDIPTPLTISLAAVMAAIAAIASIVAVVVVVRRLKVAGA